MALTATAPPDLALKIEGVLHNPKVFKASVDRSNIIFTAKRSKFGGQVPRAVSDGRNSAGTHHSYVLCYYNYK